MGEGNKFGTQGTRYLCESRMKLLMSLHRSSRKIYKNLSVQTDFRAVTVYISRVRKSARQYLGIVFHKSLFAAHGNLPDLTLVPCILPFTSET